jgi:hypothetical protein
LLRREKWLQQSLQLEDLGKKSNITWLVVVRVVVRNHVRNLEEQLSQSFNLLGFVAELP